MKKAFFDQKEMCCNLTKLDAVPENNDKIKQLESEIESLRSKLASKSNSDLNNSGEDMDPSFSTQDIDVDLPTATDALASEAAFMENIGLYLNPRQSLTKGRSFQRERTTSDCLEAADILMWCEQSTNEMPNFSESPAKSKSQSLLSFLHKPKLTSNEDIERPNAGSSDQAGKKDLLDGFFCIVSI